jgi:succinate dehydrogenase / fumarate reductase, cytochrome b subunit
MSAKSQHRERPLSPFMIGPYYRPQLTSMLSITHRATGVGLTLGTLFLCWWLLAAAAGPEAYAAYQRHAAAWYGQLLLLGWTWALFYHLCNGIRHLWWDTGRGLDLKSAYVSGYVAVAGSIVLTAALWLAAWL